jgi:large subunit ribosomal protein L10
MGVELLQPVQISALADLPALEVLRARFAGLVQTPATRIAVVLSAPASQMARVLKARADKLGEGQPAAA